MEMADARFFDANMSRSGQQIASGSDLIAPVNTTHVPSTDANLPKDAPALLADAVFEPACDGSCFWEKYWVMRLDRMRPV
jgi:hypothetical protein